MNRLTRSWWLLLLPCLLPLGCRSFVPFNHELRQQYDLSPQEIAKLQFYVSHEVTLSREVTQQRRRIENGALRLSTDSHLEEFVIEKLTPGTATQIDRDSIVVNFGEKLALRFSLASPPERAIRHEPDNNDRFASAPRLLPVIVKTDNGSGSYWLTATSSDDRVLLNGKLYQLAQESLQAHLLIATESLEDSSERRTVLGGRHVVKQ